MIEIKVNKELHGSNGTMNLDINLDIKKGEFVALSGLSGSGKTTLLRILAGLETASGTIKIENDIWLNDKFTLPSQKRDIGFVFQEYALFPNFTVMQNLLYELKDRHPHSLSGGQKQRVSLCRALMNRPKLLLMDEPLSALDPYMRTKLQNEIRTLHNEFETTTIMVSHDPSEMYRLASRVLVLDYGKIINDGLAKDILLKTKGSQKLSFEGELLDIVKLDVINIAIISIASQLVEVVISNEEAKSLEIGQRVSVSTKAFTPNIET